MKKIKVFLVVLSLLMCFSSATCMAAKFYDTIGTEYEGVVDRVAALGIINGISEKTFAPEKGLTRAELAKIITYTKGLQEYADTTNLPSSFKDVKSTHWAKNYIMVATDLGLLKGYEDGTFKPEKEVSYAEFIAITLRSLGYVNIDEKSGSTWYSGYIKRMYEIDLNKGMSNFKSYDAPAKRGDVAMMWWNMLVSERWAIDSQNEFSGLNYTYSSVTQLDYLFPDFRLVRGKVSNISNGMSGDRISVTLGGRAYLTQSAVPIYAYGAIGTGIYDPDTKMLYGFAFDEDYEDYKLVSGPTFYLEEQGYKFKNAKVSNSFGSRNDANYAYLLVSNVDNSVLRAVFMDASNSWYVDSVKVEEISEEDGGSDPENEEYEALAKVFLNDSEENLTTNEAAVILKGKLIPWEEVPEGAILTELIPNNLYTYETKVVEGTVTNYEKLTNLYIDYDRYLVSSNCTYTVYGETLEDDDDTLKVQKFSKMKKKEFEELLPRKIQYHLNTAEEITRITFGRYAPNNIIDKYDNGDYRFFYVDTMAYTTSGEDARITIGGKSFGGKNLRYQVEEKDELKKGDFVFVTDFEDDIAQEMKIVDSSSTYDDDMGMIYDISQDDYTAGGFGEYAITSKTLVFQVLKYYEENSMTNVKKTTMQRVESLDEIENLDKYMIHIFYNEEMNIDIIIAERELNKAVYPVGRVMDIWRYVTDAEVEDETDVELARVKIGTVNGDTVTTVGFSGECQIGELVTYDPDTLEDIVRIKERFRLVFLGYKGDLVIDSFDDKAKTANIVGESNILNLKEDTYEYKGREYDLLEYKYLLANVRWDSSINSWRFTLVNFYDKEDLILRAGDRIAFGELNGIAVIYRGYSE